MFSVFCFPSPVLATKTFTKLFDLFQQSRQLLGSESASLQTVNDSPKDRAKFHTGLGCANALIANGVPCAIALHTVLLFTSVVLALNCSNQSTALYSAVESVVGPKDSRRNFMTFFK